MFNNETVIYKNNGGLEYIQFKKLLKLGVKHAYTLKNEDIDFSRGSRQEELSWEKLSEAIEIDKNTLVKPIQTHTAVVKCIDKVMESSELQDVDGLITDKPNIVLTTKNADCILFLMYDPVKKVIANVHSGWKGTFQKIAEKTVVKMIDYYKCNPKDIVICICPSIRKCHFEVDEDVKDLCADIFKFTGRLDDIIEIGEIKNGKTKYMIDTVLINKILFKELGILDENVVDCGICSVCNSDKVHSARAEGEKYRRATAVICL